MKALVGMIVYNRQQTVNWWMNAWTQCEKYADAKLVVVHNHDGINPNQKERHNIGRWKPDFYYPRNNYGQDIGALRDVIRSRKYDPWDVLLWFVDDNIPLRKDFVRAFVEPFERNPKLGLVGNYWVKGNFYRQYKPGVPDHFRTSCFAIRREVAMKLYFPTHLDSKWDCYAFEWLDRRMNLTEQVRSAGYELMPVTNDWEKSWVDTSDYVWDVGCLNMANVDSRCRRDYWDQYKAAFMAKKETA